MSLEVGKTYIIGDEIARVLWIGERVVVHRTWFSDASEDDDGFEDASTIEYCELIFKPFENSVTK